MKSQTATLGELFSVGSSKRVLKSQWRTEGVPFYRGREITRLASDGYVDNELFISEKDYKDYASKYGAPEAGDIMITAIGTIGNAYVVRDGDMFYFKDASVLWLKKNVEVSSQYIHLWLKSPLFFAQLDKGNGATVDTLTISRLKSVQINLPPLPEQRQIVAILDESFESVSKAKDNAEKNLRNARELFQSYLQGVFAKGGKDWEERKLGEICDFSQGIQVDVKLQMPKKTKDSDVRFLRIVDFTQGNEPERYIERPDKRFLVCESDVSLVRYGASTGYVCTGLNGAIANNLFRVIPRGTLISNEFLFWFLRSESFQGRVRQIMNGAAMPAISFGTISDVLFRFPSPQQQTAIVLTLDSLSSETQKLEAIYQKKLADLEELKKSLLQKSFDGELTASPEEVLKEAV